MSRKRAITAFLSQKSMITRLSIAFEDFLGSSIAPQVMPPWGHPIYFDHAEYTKPTLYCQSKSPPCMEFARTGMSEASDSSGPASRRRTRQPVQNCVWNMKHSSQHSQIDIFDTVHHTSIDLTT